MAFGTAHEVTASFDLACFIVDFNTAAINRTTSSIDYFCQAGSLGHNFGS